MKKTSPYLAWILLLFVVVLSKNVCFGFTGPSVVTLQPQDNAVDVLPTNKISLTFDRNVLRGTGEIYLRRSSDNSIAATIYLWSIDVQFDGARVDMYVTVEGNKAYYLEIPNTAFKDASNNFFSGFSSPTDWNFSTFSDITSPAVVSRTPVHLSTGIASNTLISLSFNETISAGSGNILIKQSSDDATVVDIDVASGSTHLQITATSLTISAPLKPNSSYYVIIPASAVKDLYGNFFSGYTQSSEWTFTTSGVQNSVPAVVSLEPADNAVDILPRGKISMTFNRNVFRGSGNIYLRRSSDNSIAATIYLWSIDVQFDGARVDIYVTVEGNQAYYIEIPNTAFKDASNNYFPGISSSSEWNFTTFLDDTSPHVVSQVPVHQAADVAPNTLITLTFDEVIQLGSSGHIQVKKASDNATVIDIDVSNPSNHLQISANTLTISAPLQVSTAYYIIITASGIRDLYGNYFSGFSTSSGWSFTTSGVANSLPYIVSLTPTDNAIDVSPADYVHITFDRNVYRGSGDIKLRKLSDQSVAWSTPLWSFVDVRFTGPTVEILLPTEKNEFYYIEIPNTAFKDGSNNYFAGLSTQNEWNFRTTFDAPAISSFTPVKAGTDVTVTINGSNFNYASDIRFGGTPASSFTVNSSSSILAVVGAGATGDVSVTTPGGAATYPGFIFVPAPEISSFTPLSAREGDLITITGTNFTDVLEVNFGGIPASSFTVNSPTSITAVAGPGTTGDISINTLGGTTTQPGFTFINIITDIENAAANHSGTDVFPNPADWQYIFIQFDQSWERKEAEIELRDMNGKIVTRSIVRCDQLIKWELRESVPVGFYIIAISSGSKKAFHKVSIQ